jgi:DNA-binding XRE family transcriptional regulator
MELKQPEVEHKAEHAGDEPRVSNGDANQKARSSKLGKAKNNVRKFRMERMMSKAELARRAAISTLTVDRVERGMVCRMDTKRKILEALGLKPQDRVMVFGDSDED